MAAIATARLSNLLVPGMRGACSGSDMSSNVGPHSLMFDFEAEEEVVTASMARAQERAFNASLRERLRYLGSPCGDYAAKLASDVKMYKRAVLREEDCHDAVILAAKLAGVGYSVTVRRGLNAGSASIFRSLKHEFLVVRGEGDYEGVDFLVDPQFREQFEIPHPSEQYRQVLALVPDVFVGTSSRLVPLVQLVCAEMAGSFKAQGLPLPPWRQVQSMMSKWLPARAQEVTLDSSASPRAPGSPEPALARRDQQHSSSSSRGSSRSLLSSKLAGAGMLAPGISIMAPQFSGEPRAYKVKVGFPVTPSAAAGAQ